HVGRVRRGGVVHRLLPAARAARGGAPRARAGRGARGGAAPGAAGVAGDAGGGGGGRAAGAAVGPRGGGGGPAARSRRGGGGAGRAAEDARLVRAEVDRCRAIIERMRADAGDTAGEGFAAVPVAALVESAVGGLADSRVAVRPEIAAAVVDRTLTVPPRAVG